MRAALLWKEWREQGWRGVLGALVLGVIAASLVRAQLMPLPESLVLVFGPLGLLLAIFLAMGTVATERQDGTWDFLRARPVSPARILRAKWVVGAASLLIAFLLAGLAAHWAAWSRRVFVLAPPDWCAPQPRLLAAIGQTPGELWLLVALSAVAMLAWFTVLFFILTRARSELHAGLGGVLLTIAVLAWLLQYPAAQQWYSHPMAAKLLRATALLNPLIPLVCIAEEPLWRAAVAAVSTGIVWVLGPLWLVGRLDRAGRLA